MESVDVIEHGMNIENQNWGTNKFVANCKLFKKIGLVSTDYTPVLRGLVNLFFIFLL